MVRLSLMLGGAVLLSTTPAFAQSVDLRPEAGVELRAFANDPQFADQLETLQGSLILTGEARWRSHDRDTRVVVEPFVRLDSADEERTYFDLREASLSREINREWDILLGVSEVFWGRTESRNVVDVINQIDAVEDVDESEKLGQPMIRVSRRGNIGTIDAFYLPYFRERRFPGAEGRLRTQLSVDADAARYGRANEEWSGDFALRYTYRFDGIDLGLHVFHGTSRNPRLDFNPASGQLEPFYPELNQAGVDVQWTNEAWLLKGEFVVAEMLGERFISAVAGFEYTFFDISGSGLDVGLIAEYLYDDRDQALLPATLFESDVFVGTRVVLNDVQDTEFLAGAIIDDQTGGAFLSAEFQRRVGDSVLLEVEARAFEPSDDRFIAALDQDDHLTVRLTRYF
ncbi:MAG: hypothetical protein AAFX09_08595 [Pseudomonadota bacterium]